MIDDTDIDCTAWAQPGITLEQLPRIKLDVPALRAAAKDIIREAPSVVRDVLASHQTDQRLLPHIRQAIEIRKRMRDANDN